MPYTERPLSSSRKAARGAAEVDAAGTGSCILTRPSIRAIILDCSTGKFHQLLQASVSGPYPASLFVAVMTSFTRSKCAPLRCLLCIAFRPRPHTPSSFSNGNGNTSGDPKVGGNTPPCPTTRRLGVGLSPGASVLIRAQRGADPGRDYFLPWLSFPRSWVWPHRLRPWPHLSLHSRPSSHAYLVLIAPFPARLQSRLPG